MVDMCIKAVHAVGACATIKLLSTVKAWVIGVTASGRLKLIDYHLRVYVEILPKSREIMLRVRDHSVTTCCLEPSAVQKSDRVPFAWHYTASLLREHSISGSK